MLIERLQFDTLAQVFTTAIRVARLGQEDPAPVIGTRLIGFQLDRS